MTEEEEDRAQEKNLETTLDEAETGDQEDDATDTSELPTEGGGEEPPPEPPEEDGDDVLSA